MFDKKRKHQQELEVEIINSFCTLLGKYLELEQKKVELKCVEAVKGEKKDEKIHSDLP